MFILLSLVAFTSLRGQKQVTYSDNNFVYKLTRDSVLSPDSANYFCPTTSIAIFKNPDNTLVQKIKPPENTPYCDLQETFVIEDMNFDGFNDFRLFQFLPAAPNIPYYYWLYNPKTKRFELSKQLEDITSPEFDPKNKLITSEWRAGYGHYGTSTFKFINGKVTLVEEYEFFPDKNDDSKVITLYKKRIQGKMKVIKRVVESNQE